MSHGGRTATGSGRGSSTNDQVAAGDSTLIRQSGPITVPRRRDPLSLLLHVVAGVFLILAVFAPPALAIALKRRKAA